MFNPLIVIIAFILMDLIISFFSKKNENREERVEQDNKQENKQATSIFDMIKNMESKMNDSFETEPRKTEFVKSDKPVKREGTKNLAREEKIQQQKAKVEKHSELLAANRKRRKELNRQVRLSERQVPLANQDPKRRMDDYDLDQRRKVTIETQNVGDLSKSKSINKKLNIKEDILKAVIYSEILSKPKSLEK